ncbi:hypothetical protein C9926_02570 [Sulfurovum lithotrophicum]|nr:hypothetical protein C9926_02570 [Sulfurovum lithotrophicum]
MKQKKLVSYFLMIAISFTLFLPSLNLYFCYKNQNINLKNFSKKQLFSTDNLESLINYSVYKTFNFSLNEPQVIIGKDNFFFLGNSFADIVDKTEGTFQYTEKQIDSWTTKLKKLQEWYEKRGVKFIIAIASNKHTVYHDKLPDTINYKVGETVTDAIVQSSLHKNINILNLQGILEEKKEDKQLYFYTDTHWNNYGALIGYLATMEYLNIRDNKHYELPKYKIIKKRSQGGGDLTNLLKINHLLSTHYEEDYSLSFLMNNDICYGTFTKNNKLKKCSLGIKNKFNQYMINENALNKEKLLYLCDSFGLENSQLYVHTFYTVWRFHLGYMNGSILDDFVEEYKPDIVIYQVVERDLGNNSIIDDIPLSSK